MGQLQSIEADLIDLGYQIIAISPDRPEKLKESLNQGQLKYHVISDRYMDAAKAMGLAFRVSEETLTRYEEYGIDLEEASGETHHLLPVPAVFLADTDGVIQFQFTHPNYTVRLDPEILLAVAKRGTASKLMKN